MHVHICSHLCGLLGVLDTGMTSSSQGAVPVQMHAPPPPDYPIMDVHDLDKPDGFIFGFPTRWALPCSLCTAYCAAQ